MKRFLYLVLVACGVSVVDVSAADPPPNIVILLADDLGWADLGCYGSSFYETPNLDRLAKDGVQFTNFYAAAPVCSPTRASIMTGKYPCRTGVTDWIPGMKIPGDAKLATTPTRRQLSPNEVTFAEVLRAAGYQTFYTGKWHLGDVRDGLKAFGFDEFVDSPERDEQAEGGKDRADAKKKRLRLESTDLFTTAALDFLDRRDSKRPFLLMLAYHDVHTPIQAAPDFIDHFRARAAALGGGTPTIPEGRGTSRGRQDHPEYASTVAALDRSVGRIRARLGDLGLEKNTIVIFLSDNGGLSVQRRQAGPTSNLPLRAGKGFLYEGGIRVPLLVYDPVANSAEHRPSAALITMDLYPTILELAHLPLRPDQHQDGVSFAGLLRGGVAPSGRTLFWNYPHYQGSSSTPAGAVRDGDWKLVETYEDDRQELFNLKVDPGERRNLASAEPGKTARLAEQLERWRISVGAVRPPPAVP